jgi:DNA polymerase-3 subunit epsilon
VLRESLELYVKQDYYNTETVKIHGILKNSRTEQISELEAIQQLLAFLKNSVIIAHHATFDITMINRALERQGLPRLKNKVLDTSNLYKNTLITSTIFKKKDHYSLDELALKFDICKKDRHTAIGDAYITAITFLKILPRLRTKRPLTLKKLMQLG